MTQNAGRGTPNRWLSLLSPRIVHIRREGEPMRLGLNLYPWDDPASIGGIFATRRHHFRLRWSKHTRCWFWGHDRHDPGQEDFSEAAIERLLLRKHDAP